MGDKDAGILSALIDELRPSQTEVVIQIGSQQHSFRVPTSLSEIKRMASDADDFSKDLSQTGCGGAFAAYRHVDRDVAKMAHFLVAVSVSPKWTIEFALQLGTEIGHALQAVWDLYNVTTRVNIELIEARGIDSAKKNSPTSDTETD